jgi:ectoine hydroxylase-related dioxygenase (phytanoyl-CoA dioxygenase family)
VFKLSDAHRDEYVRDGFTVFRRIIPPSLIGDLRRATSRVRGETLDKWQLQPIASHIDDLGPFEDYASLPILRDALAALFGEPRTHANFAESCGLFVEPPDTPMSTPWHRDWTGTFPGLPLEQWQTLCGDPGYFSQCNCPLYQDSATWIVPSSHLWLNHRAAVEVASRQPKDFDGLELELALMENCRAMPGALQVHLEPGDFLLYRNTTWHRGVYVPYRRRATIFDFVDSPEYARWRERTDKQWHIGRQRRAAASAPPATA